MFDESEPQIFRDCNSESMLMALGGKVSKCKSLLPKDASNSMAGASTCDILNMILESLKKKCDDIYHKEANPSSDSSEENITSSLMKKKCDSMIYHYSLDDF